MIDLHLDGSLSADDCVYLAKQHSVELGDDFPNCLYVPADCPSLADYLTRFVLPVKLLQYKDAISYATYSLVKRLAKMGYIYAEIRFAPLLHTNEGMSQMDAARAALEGLEKALKEEKDIEANLILCCMRHSPEEINLETIEVAHRLKETRVVAVDLAGDEKLFPSSHYKKVFDLAKKYQLNITIHAGEATGSDEIMMAIDNGAKRIGHGVHLSLDLKTVERVKKENICFEFCPTSNLQTKSLCTYNDVPLRRFMECNIPVTINSDNMTVSNVSAISEMSIMKKTFNLSKQEVFALLSNSINYAFTSDEVKAKLKEKLAKRIDEYYQNL